MKRKGVFAQALAWSAAIAMVVPAVPVSAFATEASPIIRDVALSSDGMFLGQFISSDGQPVSAAVVVVRAGDQTIAESVTDAEGQFRLSGIAPGVYDVTVGDTTETVRVWSHVAAPPSAATNALISQPVVRGQFGSYGGNTMGVVFGLTGIALGTIALVEVHNLSNRVDTTTSP